MPASHTDQADGSASVRMHGQCHTVWINSQQTVAAAGRNCWTEDEQVQTTPVQFWYTLMIDHKILDYFRIEELLDEMQKIW